MKYLMTTILLVAASLVSLSATAQVKELEKFSDMKNVDYVYISKMMIDIAIEKGISVAGITFEKNNVIKKLSSVQIITTGNSKTSQTVKKDVDAILSARQYQTLMTTSDEDSGDKVKVSYKKAGKQSAVIMQTEDSGELCIVALTGTFTMDDIKSLAGRNL